MKKPDYNKNYQFGDETWRGNFVNPVLNNAIQTAAAMMPDTEDGTGYTGIIMGTYQCHINGTWENTLKVICNMTCGAPRILAYEPCYADNDCADTGINGLDGLRLIGEIQMLDNDQAKSLMTEPKAPALAKEPW